MKATKIDMANAPVAEDVVRATLRPVLDTLMDDAVEAYFEVAARHGHAAGMEAAHAVLGVVIA